jgi:hypothetical protein
LDVENEEKIMIVEWNKYDCWLQAIIGPCCDDQSGPSTAKVGGDAQLVRDNVRKKVRWTGFHENQVNH